MHYEGILHTGYASSSGIFQRNYKQSSDNVSTQKLFPGVGCSSSSGTTPKKTAANSETTLVEDARLSEIKNVTEIS